jgi:hypothetical protein
MLYSWQQRRLIRPSIHLKGAIMATKKSESTSAKVASTAAKLLSNPRTPASVKSVAASALTQKVAAPKKR